MIISLSQAHARFFGGIIKREHVGIIYIKCNKIKAGNCIELEAIYQNTQGEEKSLKLLSPSGLQETLRSADISLLEIEKIEDGDRYVSLLSSLPKYSLSIWKSVDFPDEGVAVTAMTTTGIAFGLPLVVVSLAGDLIKSPGVLIYNLTKNRDLLLKDEVEDVVKHLFYQSKSGDILDVNKNIWNSIFSSLSK